MQWHHLTAPLRVNSKGCRLAEVGEGAHKCLIGNGRTKEKEPFACSLRCDTMSRRPQEIAALPIETRLSLCTYDGDDTHLVKCVRGPRILI